MGDKGERGGKANADIGWQRGSGVLATNDITDKMNKNTINIGFSLTHLYILLFFVKYCVFFLLNLIIHDHYVLK